MQTELFLTEALVTAFVLLKAHKQFMMAVLAVSMVCSVHWFFSALLPGPSLAAASLAAAMAQEYDRDQESRERSTNTDDSTGSYSCKSRGNKAQAVLRGWASRDERQRLSKKREEKL